jgi:uncharacterized membrane protein
MSNNNSNNGGIWPILIVVFVIGAIVQMFTGAGTGSSRTTQSYSPDPSSFEHRYVKERVKLEGYSDKEAAQAADAIMRFHEAQKARQK